MTKHNAERPTAVYWLWSAGTLLYVGISNHPMRRFVQHRDTKDWWPRVTHYSIRWFGTRAEAETAEALAIKNDGPQMNTAMQPRLDPSSSRPAVAAWKGDELLNALVDLAQKLRPDCDVVFSDETHPIINKAWLHILEMFAVNRHSWPVERRPVGARGCAADAKAVSDDP